MQVKQVKQVKLIALIALYISACISIAQETKDACIPRVEYIAQDSDDVLGSYERISPDGRFILRSFSGHKLGDVTLLEIVNSPQGKRVVHHATPLKNEAFPVQGTWRYLVNTNGDHYRLSDVLKEGKRAKPLFRGGMTGFYAAAAELLAESENEYRIRSLSWPTSGGEGVGALSVRTLTIDAKTERIKQDTGSQFICSERRKLDGTQYGLPMMSVDGTEFSAVPQSPRVGEQTMRVFAMGKDIHQPKCEQQADLQFASGKATFGFSQPAAADLVFEYRHDVWWYSRSLNESFNLADYQQTASVGGFPGITRDGRIIVAASWLEGDAQCRAALPSSKPAHCKLRKGYALIDPYQSAAYRNYIAEKKITAPNACITQADVKLEHERFAKLHGLTFD